MVEIYGFIAVSVIAWAWLALLYWFLAWGKANHERRLKNLERHDDRRKAEEEAENEEVADEMERMFCGNLKDSEEHVGRSVQPCQQVGTTQIMPESTSWTRQRLN